MDAAKGFDELIEALLQRVALCGEDGATIADFKKFLAEFYGRQHGVTNQNEIDRRLEERVWVWLAEHPDIWIGHDRRGIGLTLAEAEARNARSDGEPAERHERPQDQTQTPLNETGQSQPPGEELRIYTTQDRVWHAVTGHGVDYKKVPRLEFQLLALIAAAGPTGILQPDLRTMSGQDKRSVPKRTDALTVKGYIVKKAVYAKNTMANHGGSKTSLVVHSMFNKKDNSRDPTGDGDASQQKLFVNDSLVLENFIDTVLPLLESFKPVAIYDLKQYLAGSVGRWHEKYIWRGIERLHYLGIATRVLAKMRLGNPRGYIRCVKLLRIPTEEDRKRFNTVKSGEVTRWRQSENAKHALGIQQGNASKSDEEPDSEDQDAEGELDDTLEWAGAAPVGPDDSGSTNQTGISATDIQEHSGQLEEVDDADLAEPTPILPQWEMGIQLQNFMFDLIDKAGIGGVQSLDLMQVGYGSFWRRPLDNTLGRMTDAWEISQPSYLKHLAVIRDTTLTSTGRAYYIYRTYNNFVKAVEEGQASWDAVRLPSTKKGQARKAVENTQLDEWGFPVIPMDKLTKRNGGSTLEESVAVVTRTSEKLVSYFDPVVAKNSDGSMKVVWSDAVSGPHMAGRHTPNDHHSTPSKSGGFLKLSNKDEIKKASGKAKALKQNMKAMATPRKRGRPPKHPLTAVEISVPPPAEPGGSVRERPVDGNSSALYYTDPSKYRRMLEQRKWLARQIQRQAERIALEEAVLNCLAPSASEDHAPESPPSMSKTNSSNRKHHKRQREIEVEATSLPPAKRPQLATSSVNNDANSKLDSQTADQQIDRSSRLKLPGLNALIAKENMWQMSISKIASQQSISASQDRILQLKAALVDTGRIGVHLNPFGALEFLHRKKRTRTLRLIFMVRLDGLQRLSCFVNNPGATGVPPLDKPNLLPDEVPEPPSLHPSVSHHADEAVAITPVTPPVEPVLVTPVVELIKHTHDSDSSTNLSGTLAVDNIEDTSALQPGVLELNLSVDASDVVLESTIRLVHEPDGQIGLSATSDNSEEQQAEQSAQLSTSVSVKSTPQAKLTSKRGVGGPDRTSSLPQYGGLASLANSPAGLYVKPKGSYYRRGKPKKTMVAVVKSDRLKELRCLHPDGTFVPDVSQIPRQVTPTDDEQEGSSRSEAGMEIVNVVSTPTPAARTIMPLHPSVLDDSQPKTDSLQRTEEQQVTEPGKDATEPQLESERIEPSDTLDRGNEVESPTGEALQQLSNDTVTSGLASHPGEVAETSQEANEGFQYPETAVEIEDSRSAEQVDEVDHNFASAEDHLDSVHDFTAQDNRHIEDDANDQDYVPPEPELVAYEVPSTMTRAPRKERERKQGVSLGEGTVGRNRSKIVMQLIEMCGGLFPGKNEMIPAFRQLWMREYPGPTMPERKTIARAIQRLVDTARLNRIDFHFQDDNGVSQIRTIILLPSISVDSPLVRELQQKIIDKFPDFYYPPAIVSLIPRASRKTVQGPILMYDDTIEVDRIYKPYWMRVMEERAKNPKPLGRPRKVVRKDGNYRAPKGRLQSVRQKRRQTNNVETGVAHREEDPTPLPNIYNISDDEESDLSDRPIVPAGLTEEWVPPPGNFPTSKPARHLSASAFPDEVDGNLTQIEDAHRLSQWVSRLQSKRQRTGLHGHFLDEHRRWKPVYGIVTQTTINSLMAPAWSFHSLSGTFSTSFSGFDARTVPQPHSLQDILCSSTALVDNADLDPANDEAVQFFKELSRVSSWEIALYPLMTTQKPQQWNFVNHTLNIPHDGVNRQALNEFSWNANTYLYGPDAMSLQQSTAMKYRVVPELQPLWRPGRMRRQSTAEKRPAPTGELSEQETPRPKRHRKTRFAEYPGDPAIFQLPPMEPAVSLPVEKPPVETPPVEVAVEVADVAHEPDGDQSVASPENFVRQKRSLRSRNPTDPKCQIDAAATTRMLMAIIAIRTLIGGTEQSINWNVFQTIFQDYPHFNLTTFKWKWTQLQRYEKRLISRYQAAFEDKFLEAYAAGKFPMLNFKSPRTYDWDVIVDWAVQKIAVAKDAGVQQLPANHQTLLDNFTIEEDQGYGTTSLLPAYKDTTGNPQRFEILHDYGYHVKLDKSRQAPQASKRLQDREDALMRAKSWIRANIATPVPAWDSQAAYNILATIPKKLQDEALRYFRTKDIFAEPNKGRSVPGRSFYLQERFMASIKRPIEPSHLAKAVEFKKLLDERFASSDDPDGEDRRFYKLPYDANDGVILALTNLAAHRRVNIIPQVKIDNDVDAPHPRISKWGWEPGVYKTGQMNREYIYFDLHIVPTAAYVSGNPLATRRRADGRMSVPELAPLDLVRDPRALIPIWHDIHGRLIAELWTRVATSVLQIIVTRPGIGAAGIEEHFKGNLWLWELKMLVGELRALGAIKPVGSCGNGGDWLKEGREGVRDSWTTTEWWWMVLADVPG